MINPEFLNCSQCSRYNVLIRTFTHTDVMRNRTLTTRESSLEEIRGGCRRSVSSNSRHGHSVLASVWRPDSNVVLIFFILTFWSKIPDFLNKSTFVKYFFSKPQSKHWQGFHLKTCCFKAVFFILGVKRCGVKLIIIIIIVIIINFLTVLCWVSLGGPWWPAGNL